MKGVQKCLAPTFQALVNKSILSNPGLVLAATVLFLLSAGPMSYSATAAEIILSWTEIQEQVRPQRRTFRMARSIRLSLRGGNVITHSGVWTDPQGRAFSKGNEGRLGTVHVGEKNKATWSVKDSKSLVRTVEGVQHTSVITVTTQSDTSCSATISHALKPGFQEYLYFREVDGAPTYMRSLSAENLTCRINP